MITFFLASLFVLALVKAATPSLKPWDPRTNPCQFTLDDFHFNLCPLLDERHNSGRIDLVLGHETAPTVTTIVYNISLNGPLPKSDAVPEDEQCVSGTWVCVTTHTLSTGRDVGKDNRRTQVVPIVLEAPQGDLRQDASVGDWEDFGIYAELRESAEGKPSLSLHMHGGYHVDVSQRVQIDFECAESENDAPKLSVVRNGTHVLTWATRHACAQVYQTLFQDDGASDSPPEDDDEPANQDLVSLPDRNGPFVATIIVCSSAALFGLGYLVIRPPDVLRRHIRRTLFQRDTREAKLLRWATEEFEMLGIDEFEEDEMVNSHPLPDEQIPLRPNHIYSPFVDYGTVR